MLLYNNDGTVSEVIINAIIAGKVTSSLQSVSTTNFAESASKSIFASAISAGSSSNSAYELAYANNDNRTNKGTTYLSSATVQKTYSANSYAVLNPTNTNRNRGTNYGVTGSFTISAGISTFGTASWSELNNLQLYSASIATGSIAKVSIPTTAIKPYINSALNTYNDISKLNIYTYNGIHSVLTGFTQFSSSVNGTTSSFAVFYISASRANMANIASNDLKIGTGTNQLKSTTVRKTPASQSENAAFEAKYPTNKSDWSLINGVLTSPKNQ